MLFFVAIRTIGCDLPLLPAGMVNEYEYYPRLSYLERVQGEWAEPGDTVVIGSYCRMGASPHLFSLLK